MQSEGPFHASVESRFYLQGPGFKAVLNVDKIKRDKGFRRLSGTDNGSNDWERKTLQ